MLPTNPTLLAVLALATTTLAKTDIGGCVSSSTRDAYNQASMIWYVPSSGEICELLDCGGGRAPPKTTVPGCAAYQGTATYSPKYLPGWGAGPTGVAESTPAATSVAAVTTEAVETMPSHMETTPAAVTSAPAESAAVSSAAMEVMPSYTDAASSAGSTAVAESSAYVSSALGSASSFSTVTTAPVVVVPSSAAASGSSVVAVPSSGTSTVFGGAGRNATVSAPAAAFTGAAAPLAGVGKGAVGLAIGLLGGLAVL